VSTVLLIDGDVLCYLACPSRYNKNESVFFDENGNKIPKEFTKEEDTRYLKLCWKNAKNMVKSYMTLTFADDYLMAIKGDSNFRDEIYPDYKAHRKNKPSELRNEFVPILRDLLLAEEMAIAAEGREADDLLRIWHTEAIANGDTPIVASIDKDLRMIEGSHWHMKDNCLRNISKEEGLRLFYEQLLKGDPTDNIPGLPGVGPKRAEAILSCYNTEEEFRIAVIEAYKLVYEDDWRNYLLSNGKLLHIQRNYDDYFTLADWSITESTSVPLPKLSVTEPSCLPVPKLSAANFKPPV